MSDPPGGPAPGGRPAPLARVAVRVRALADRTSRWPGVPTAREILRTFDAAGGGLLGGGLAYAALIALLPAIVLAVALVGFVVERPEDRAAIVAELGRLFPPVAAFAEGVVDQAVDGRIASSIVGLAGLAWGASRFYVALDDAFARIFRHAPVRGVVDRSVRGVIAILIVIGGLVGLVAVTGWISAWLAGGIFADLVSDATGPIAAVVPIGATAALAVIAVGVVYRLVPARRVTWRAIGPPAIVVGVALTAFTQAFTFIAPRLLGVAALYGALVAVFALLAWLSIGFQLLLLGAAWVRVRMGGPGHDPGDRAAGA